jgi:hypothetical protein
MAVKINNPPEPKIERVSRLVTRIEGGDVKIPKFQRGFVWTRQQILELLDSVYQGYPIGSVLFWLTERKLASERNIGGFHLPETPEKYPTNYVLDGQQRLTTIYGVLRGPDGGGNPDLKVCFDLESREFLHADGPPTHAQIPMNIVLNVPKLRRFQQGLLALRHGDVLVEESDRLVETFREYSLPVVTISEADIGQVSGIFERINSTGTKLTVFDLMVAATWSEDFDLNDHVDEILAQLDEKDFADLDKVTILRALATCGFDSAKRDTILQLRDLSRDELARHMEVTKEAIRRAVDFLATQVCVLSNTFLPYERQLVVVAYIMSKKPDLAATEIDVLRRWFWRTSFSERYRRGGEGLFDTDLNIALQALSDPNRLEHFGGPVTSKQVTSTDFRKTGAFSNAFVAMLARHGPRNLTNGAAIDVGRALSSYNRKEFHHIFPTAFLRSGGLKESGISSPPNSLANICMLSCDQNKVVGARRPSVYFRQIQGQLGDAFRPVLESNLIPVEAVRHIEADDYPQFLRARSRYLAKAMKALM